MTRAQFLDVEVRFGEAAVVRSVTLELVEGEFLALVGPNGSGKSSLLRTIYRAIRPAAGAVMLQGTDVWKLKASEVARTVAVVAQERPDDFDFNAADVVRMGRTPHLRLLTRAGREHDRICLDALERVGCAHLAGRVFHTLSGGEKQRILIARALAQEPEILILDEPTNHLDIAAQVELLSLIRTLGITVVAALHDLNHAAAYADRVAVLDAGALVGLGPHAEVLTPELIEEVFRVRAHISTHPGGRPLFAFDPLATPIELTDNSFNQKKLSPVGFTAGDATGQIDQERDDSLSESGDSLSILTRPTQSP